jgi:acyl-CoA reductase-like NAD-dependent aldehyde dehydrogenase
MSNRDFNIFKTHNTMERGIPKFSPYINGAMVEPSSGKFFQRFDLGDKGNLIGLVGDGSRDVGAAVDAAREAFDGDRSGWVSDYRLRARVLLRAAEIVRGRA